MKTKAARFVELVQLYLEPGVRTMLFLGFSCGLPLALTASTLFAWLYEVGIDKSSIGVFAAIAMPYSLKFLWSPLMDGTKFPILHRLLGRRRGWLLATQMALAVAIAAMVTVDPSIDPWMFGFVAFFIAFTSASQDIVVDAYRVERIPAHKQAAAAAMYSLGYRGAMLISGAGALVMAQILQNRMGYDFTQSWHLTYLSMAALMGVGILTTFFIAEPGASNDWNARHKEGDKIEMGTWLREYMIDPFADFMKRPGWIHILLFVALFRLADAYLGVMVNPFLLELGFTKIQIAEIVKLYGMIATMVGALLGGVIVMRFGMYKTLMACGLLHMLTNLLLVGLAHIGVNEWYLALCIISENSTAGMTSGAFIAYLSSLCRINYTATQYALLSSLAGVGRTLVSSSSGVAAEVLGWAWFFFTASLLAIPALALLWYIERRFGVDEAKKQ